MTTYEFTVTLVARVHVKAASQAEAEVTLRDGINGSGDAELGSYPDGEPIIASVCVEGGLELESVDGEPS